MGLGEVQLLDAWVRSAKRATDHVAPALSRAAPLDLSAEQAVYSERIGRGAYAELRRDARRLIAARNANIRALAALRPPVVHALASTPDMARVARRTKPIPDMKGFAKMRRMVLAELDGTADRDTPTVEFDEVIADIHP